MDINLTSGNPLKLFSKFFMHVAPAAGSTVTPGGKYNAICDVYGRLGQVECIKVWKGIAFEQNDLVFELAEGMANFRAYTTKKNILQSTPLQVSVFRFIRRYDDNIFKLLKAETTKAGLPFFQQQNLFI